MSDGYEGGYDGGYDAGHESYDLNALHAEQANEHDQYTNFQEFAATHAEEEDVHFANYHNVEASDGKGAYYSETDVTEYDAHNASVDTVYDQEYTNAQHDSSYSELDKLRESFEKDYLSVDGGGYSELTAK